jgi:ankyrin repeat protein
MNIKKTIIFTGLSLLLSSTFNSAYSAEGAGDEKDPSRKRSFHSATESDGYGAGGGASSSASGAGKTPGDWAGLPLEGLAATPSNAPRGWEQHVRTGVAYFKEGKFPKAIAQFTAALDIEGIDGKARASCLNNLGRSHFNLGNAYAGQKNYGDAIAQFRLASKVVPDRVRSKLKGPLGIELLMHAIDIESQENARFLIANGVAINARDNHKNSVLMCAKSVEMAELLLDRGADVYDKVYENIPLFRAIELGSVEMARLLLDRGARVNDKDYAGDTPLFGAIESGSVEMARLLLDRGAYINAEDKEGLTPLLVALWNNDVKKVELLLSKGADVNAGRGAASNLFWALQEEKLRNLLFDNGVEADARDNDGKTALMFEAMSMYEGGYYDPDTLFERNLRILLERGANVNAVDQNGKTALMHAVESFQDNEGYNEYYLKQLKSRVALLINSGADIGIKDKEGHTVFNLCKEEDLRQFIKDADQQYSSGRIDLK